MKTEDLDQYINKLDLVAETMLRKFNTYIFDLGADLTSVQQYLLKILSVKGSSTPSEIAHHMGVTSGAVTSLTDRLSKQGYIVRERSEKDRRLVIIKLTAKGEKKSKLVEQYRMEKMRKLFSQLKPKSIENLCEVYYEMDKILSVLLEK